MGHGGRTPEEAETLLEDACIGRDLGALLSLFDDGAVLVAGTDGPPARGGGQIARAAPHLWRRSPTYVAGTQRVLQTRDLALSMGGGTNVLRRGPDGAWRFAIALLHIDGSLRDGEQT